MQHVIVIYRHPDAETSVSTFGVEPVIIHMDYGSAFDGSPSNEDEARDWLGGVGSQLAWVAADHPAREEVVQEALSTVADYFTEDAARAELESAEADGRAARDKAAQS
jgi:hypothetical protein